MKCTSVTHAIFKSLLSEDDMEESVKHKETKKTTCYLFWKRALDVFFSCLLLVLLALPMALIAVAIVITSRGGALFRQIRIGRGGVPFTCYKFRTMYREAPPNRPSATFWDAAHYVTPIGRFLRRTSLDELPQLFNVLRGDMSLVGPRPLIGEEQEIHHMRQKYGVYAVRPGMTGLAQVHGRDSLCDNEKAAFDARYVERLSFWADARIVGKTLHHVLTGENAK